MATPPGSVLVSGADLPTCKACGYTPRPGKSKHVRSAFARHRCADRVAARQRSEAWRRHLAETAVSKPCQHIRKQPDGAWVERHAHGTAARYTLDGCHCVPCRAASLAYSRRRDALVQVGRWNGLQDAAPVRKHVLALRDAGLPTLQLSRETGVSLSCLEGVIAGRHGRPPSQRLLGSSARAILAVRIDHRAIMMRVGDRTPVPACGTQRRLRALVALGWSMKRLGDRIGMEADPVRDVVNGTNPKVLAGTARAVVALYDELWNTRPNPVTRPERVAVTKTVKLAASRGWVVGAYWDDDVIDDPKGKPARANDRDWSKDGGGRIKREEGAA